MRLCNSHIVSHSDCGGVLLSRDVPGEAEEADLIALAVVVHEETISTHDLNADHLVSHHSRGGS